MAKNTGLAETEQNLAIRNYFLVCMAAMFVLLVLLLRRRLGPWSLAPVVVGVMGTAIRLRFAPALTLIVLVGTIIALDPFLEVFGMELEPLFDGILSAALLAYFVAHYRLLGLAVAYFPADRGKRMESLAEAASADSDVSPPPSLRSPESISPFEMSWFIVSLPIWAVLAQLIRTPLAALGASLAGHRRLEFYELRLSHWQGVIFVWTIGVTLFVLAGLLGYLIWRRRSAAAATLWLQDVVWRETSRDQQRVGQALARARRRRLRGKEVP
jgi:hypothetical protein